MLHRVTKHPHRVTKHPHDYVNYFNPYNNCELDTFSITPHFTDEIETQRIQVTHFKFTQDKMLMKLRFKHREPDICTSVINMWDPGVPTRK